MTLPLYVEVDEIYNLACPASPIHDQHDPVHTTKTSVMGAINMLGLAKRPTGEWSISWACVPATTKASAAPRPCFAIIAGSTISTSGWPASSTPIGQRCIRRTAG